MVIGQKLYTAEEFWELMPQLDPDRRFELIEGEIVEVTPSSPVNSMIAGRILAFLFQQVDPRNLGYVLGADGGYTLAAGEVRLPDVSFVAKNRMPDPIPSRLDIPPDLAVEVISPGERPGEIRKKITLYLDSGVRLVWIVYPEDQIVDVWQTDEINRHYVRQFGLDDTLDGGDVLPGLELPVKHIFP